MSKSISIVSIGIAPIVLMTMGGQVFAQASDVVCNKCVDSSDIAGQAVNAVKLAPQAVTESRLAPEAVTASKLAPQAVTTGKLARRAVTTSKIRNGAVTNDKLADNHSLDAADGDPVDVVSVDASGDVSMTRNLIVATEIRVPEIQVERPGDFGQSGLIEIRNQVPWARSIIIFDNNGNHVFNVALDGAVNGKSFNVLSDRRLKTNIEEIGEPLEKVLNLRGVIFDWLNDEVEGRTSGGKHRIGFLAQEVNEVFPEAVHDFSDGTLSVDYSALIPVLVEAMKQQQQQINELTSELSALTGERE